MVHHIFSLVLLCSFIFSVRSLAGEHLTGSRPAPLRAQEKQSDTQKVDDGISSVDLEMYLQVLNEREAVLKAANEALLHEADYSFVKIPLFMLKGAIEGYTLGRLLGIGGAATTTATAATTLAQKKVSERALQWIANGGLEKLKTFGFNVGVLGVSAANNSALLKGYRWQYGIPILGTAMSAYSWSDQLMNSPELIEKHGKEILAIRKEKHRIRSLLEKQ